MLFYLTKLLYPTMPPSPNPAIFLALRFLLVPRHFLPYDVLLFYDI